MTWWTGSWEGGVELEEGRTSDVDRVVGGGCRVGRGADKWHSEFRSHARSILPHLFLSGPRNETSTRPVVVSPLEKQTGEAEDEVVDIPDDAETNAAATKMQAMHRGKRARSDVRQRKEAGQTPAAPPPREELPSEAVKADEDDAEETPEERRRREKEEAKEGRGSSDDVVDIPDDADTNAAATKVQALHRGKKTRREVEQKKRGRKTAEEEGEEQHSPSRPDHEQISSPDREFVIADFLVSLHPKAEIETADNVQADFLSRTHEGEGTVDEKDELKTPAIRTKPAPTDTPEPGSPATTGGSASLDASGTSAVGTIGGSLAAGRKLETVSNPFVSITFNGVVFKDADGLAEAVSSAVESGNVKMHEELSFTRVRVDDALNPVGQRALGAGGRCVESGVSPGCGWTMR